MERPGLSGSPEKKDHVGQAEICPVMQGWLLPSPCPSPALEDPGTVWPLLDLGLLVS